MNVKMLHFLIFKWYIENYGNMIYYWTSKDFYDVWPEPRFYRKNGNNEIVNHFYEKFMLCEGHAIPFFIRLDENNKKRISDKVNEKSDGLIILSKSGKYIDVNFWEEELEWSLMLLNQMRNLSLETEEDFDAFWKSNGPVPKKGCLDSKKLWAIYKAENNDAIRFFLFIDDIEKKHLFKILCYKTANPLEWNKKFHDICSKIIPEK